MIFRDDARKRRQARCEGYGAALVGSLTMTLLWCCLLALALFLALGFIGVPLWLWTLAALGFGWWLGAPLWLLIPIALIGLFFNLRPLRARFLTGALARRMKAAGILPVISETERIALEAGTVWMDGELFSGKPALRKILDQPYPGLSAETEAFLEGPV